METTSLEAKKISGLLYLVGFNIFGTLILNLSQVISALNEYHNDLWTMFTSTVSTIHFPVIILELISPVILLFFQGIQCYLFLKKDFRFPKIFSYCQILSAISSTLLFFTLYKFPEIAQIDLQELRHDMIKALVRGFFWILYIKKSIQVKETFVNQGRSLNLLSYKVLYLAPLALLGILFIWQKLISE